MPLRARKESQIYKMEKIMRDALYESFLFLAQLSSGFRKTIINKIQGLDGNNLLLASSSMYVEFTKMFENHILKIFQSFLSVRFINWALIDV